MVHAGMDRVGNHRLTPPGSISSTAHRSLRKEFRRAVESGMGTSWSEEPCLQNTVRIRMTHGFSTGDNASTGHIDRRSVPLLRAPPQKPLEKPISVCRIVCQRSHTQPNSEERSRRTEWRKPLSQKILGQLKRSQPNPAKHPNHRTGWTLSAIQRVGFSTSRLVTAPHHARTSPAGPGSADGRGGDPRWGRYRARAP